MAPEPDCSQSISQRLPDTCPISQTDLSQQQLWATQNIQEPWGRLYPANPDFHSLELTKDEYTVGRGSDCDLSMKTGTDARVLGAISKVHFRIRRTNISSTNHEDYIVYLDDLSFNGTFVNGRKIGKGNSVILENNNEIAMCFAHLKAFVYISSSLDSEVKAYPEEVKMQYAIGRILGRGSFGQVRLVFDKTSGKALAMKVIPKKKFCNDTKQHLYDPKRTQREVDILKALSNIFVIKFHNMMDSRNYMFILTEYMEGGELFDRVKCGPLSELDAKFYFFQLALAVRYLHSHGIIHRDIKLENILLASKGPETIIKLSDFGFSKFLDSESVMMTYCGTPLYIAPEILKNKGMEGSYDKKVDNWSMGVVLYICLSGVTPFSTSNTHNLTEQILNGSYSFSMRQWGTVSRKAINLVRKMLTVNPNYRISTENILNHEWLKDRTITMKVNRVLRNVNSDNQPTILSEDEIDSDVENSRTAKRPRLGN